MTFVDGGTNFATRWHKVARSRRLREAPKLARSLYVVVNSAAT